MLLEIPFGIWGGIGHAFSITLYNKLPSGEYIRSKKTYCERKTNLLQKIMYLCFLSTSKLFTNL